MKGGKNFMLDSSLYLSQLQSLLAIDSTTSQFRDIQEYIVQQCSEMGCSWHVCHKGGVVADLGGEGNPIVVAAHFDDVGLMVRHINADGTLNLCRIGGLYPANCTGENVRVYTRDAKVYTGTICRTPNSIHVTEDEIRATLPDYRTNVCVVLDEDVQCAGDVRALGVDTGDVIALAPRFTTVNGFIKSRFLDDKACVAILLTMMRELAGEQLGRKVYFYFSAYEEIGHGTAWLPDGVKDVIALDIAPTGPEQNSDEHKVSIFASDTKFPYHWELTNELREAAKRAGADYAMDIFTPHFSSDADTPVLSGYDVRHAGMGPGTSNSHGYERTHMDAIRNTYRLLKEYLSPSQDQKA